MNALHHPPRGVTAAATVFTILVLITVPARAQLSLVSMTPAHGSENVDTQQPIVLTFDQSIDTTASFGDGEGFFLSAQAMPDPGPPSAIELNEAGNELTLLLNWEADTQYWIVLMGAKSESGDDLDRPYAWTFSTGTLPTGSVSGTISFPGSTPQGAVVGLFPPSFFRDQFTGDGEDEGPAFLAATVVTESDGSYQLDYVPVGNYLPFALRDVDGDFEPTPGLAGEGLGFYIGDDTGAALQFALSEGQDRDNVDMEIRSDLSTAAQIYDGIVSLAELVHDDAGVTGIQGVELTRDGEAAIWLYSFYSPGVPTAYGLASVYGYYLSIGTLSFGDGEDDPFDPTSFLAGDWIDSPAALQAADQAVGDEYRMENTDVSVSAALFMLDLPGGEATAKRLSGAQRAPAWIVTYESFDAPETRVVVDALSGEVLFALGGSSAARSLRAVANQAAMTWQPDAVLVFVGSNGVIGPGGRAESWAFTYYSATVDAILSVFVNGGIVVDQEEGNANDVPSTVPLPAEWVDSDVATAAADASSDDFRNQYPEGEVFARLSRGFVGGNPDRLLWVFDYRVDSQAPVLMTIFVDALSGQVTTAREPIEVPGSVSSLESYPNPTTGAATIRYELDEADAVHLVIANALGQVVRRMEREISPPGLYEIRWDGTDDAGLHVAAGIYWCRIQSSGGIQATTLTVVR